ncbi:Serine/threonine-protein kinase AfsK [Streptomyces netropsis]|nr:Serine/threonine-protein kinase AfsK [Streptomyces netropsis]
MDALWPDDPQWVGPYRLDGRLGAGGMGQVYLGTSPGGRKVAVKLIRAELAATPQFRTRFAREVDAARQVGGFHTAQVVDADPDAESPWLVTAFIPGPTLRQVVAERGPLAADAVLRLGAGLAEGLTAIHRCGLVHRDLKPGNVIMADDGPRIIDFGIARAVDASSLTATGAIVGTYAYMSPEQIRADRAGPASDVFALGSVLAFAATGRSPFDAPTLLAVVQRILDEPPVLGGLDGELRRLLVSCLAKDPADRPAVAGLPARFAGARGGEAAVHPPRPEQTVVLAPAERTRPEPVAPRDGAADAGAGAQPYAVGARGPAPVASAESGPTVPGTGRVSRRAFIVGGLAVAAATAVTVPVLLRREDGNDPSSPASASPQSAGAKEVTLKGPVSVHALAFAPDGTSLVTAGGEGTIWRWDLATGRSTTTRIGVAEYLQPNAFSRDVKLLVRAEKNKVLLWDVATGRTVGTFTGITSYRLQDGFVSAMSLSPDGRTLAASTSKGLYVWDVVSGRTLDVHEDSKSGPTAFSPDGKLLISGYPLQVRQMPGGRTLAALDEGTTSREALFSPDGQILAIAQLDDTVRLWNTSSRQDVVTLKGHKARIQALAFHPGGRTLASADQGGTVRLWDTATATVTTTFTSHNSIAAVAFSPDGKTLAAGLNGGTSYSTHDTVRLWKLP